MLDNDLLFSLMVSTLITFSMYIYKKYYVKNIENTNNFTNELLFLFIFSFIITFGCKYCTTSNVSNPPVTVNNTGVKSTGQCPF